MKKKKAPLALIIIFGIIILSIAFYFLFLGIYLSPPRFISEAGFSLIYFRSGLHLRHIEFFDSVIKTVTMFNNNPEYSRQSREFYDTKIKPRAIIYLPFDKNLYNKRLLEWMRGK